MKNFDWDGFKTGFTVSVVVMGILFCILAGWLGETGYRKGQIDAVTGNMRYERVMNADSTVTWEPKK